MIFRTPSSWLVFVSGSVNVHELCVCVKLRFGDVPRILETFHREIKEHNTIKLICKLQFSAESGHVIAHKY